MPPDIAGFDNLVMLGVSLLLVAMMYSGRTITRAEGALLVLGYAVYLAVLWPK